MIYLGRRLRQSPSNCRQPDFEPKFDSNGFPVDGGCSDSFVKLAIDVVSNPGNQKLGHLLVKRFLFRRLNSLLSGFGLSLDRTTVDFGNFPLDRYSKNRIFDALAGVYDEWIDKQAIFAVQETFDTAAAVGAFFGEWLKMPFRVAGGGSRFNNLLWLYLISRSYQPSIIVDSGTFQGASVWALHKGCSTCDAFSFDIDLSRTKHRCPGPVRYIEKDWMSYGSLNGDQERALVYFDDHLDQVRRLSEAIAMNFKLAIFDDDFPVTSYYVMAPSGDVLPKLEFVLDDDLRDGQLLEWSYAGRSHRWVVDRDYLDAVKLHIAATERLPNTSLITGIHQTPYRIVSIS